MLRHLDVGGGKRGEERSGYGMYRPTHCRPLQLPTMNTNKNVTLVKGRPDDM